MLKLKHTLICCAVITIAIISLCRAEVNPQITPLTPAVQAIMFSKMFSYISLYEKAKPKILVVYEKTDKSASVISNAFEREGIESTIAEVSLIPDLINNYSVIYLTKGLSASKLKKALKGSHILTISGDPDVVISGEASISVGLEKNKPKIILNYPHVQKEYCQVSAELFNLAIVIR